jgi:hypothetical protein
VTIGPRAERGALLFALAFLPLMAATVAAAQDVPLPAWVKSGEVNEDGAVVYAAADEHAPRRGTVAIGTRLPVQGRVRGAGCGDFRFVQVGDEAFICEQKLVWSNAPPGGVQQPLMAAGALLPHDYAFVVSDGTGGYARPSDYTADEFAIVLGQDFGVVVAERVTYDGLGFTRSEHGYYLLDESLRTRPVSTFEGVKITDGKLDGISWPVPGKPGVKTKTKARIQPQLTAAPKDLLPGERWVDVDTERQTLVVYEGDKPIFATLVSTGLPSPVTETPKGELRVWAKLTSSDMNDTEREDAVHNYSIEAVPWVLYLGRVSAEQPSALRTHEGIALHAAFWHDRFGEKHSHGCVNLSPKDARTVFELVGPVLPAGWYAILPTANQPGARVIVR